MIKFSVVDFYSQNKLCKAENTVFSIRILLHVQINLLDCVWSSLYSLRCVVSKTINISDDFRTILHNSKDFNANNNKYDLDCYIPSPSLTFTTLTVCLWPLNTLVQSPNSVTHARAVWSELPVYMILLTI